MEEESKTTVHLSQEEKREIFRKRLEKDPSLRKNAFHLLSSSQFKKVVQEQSDKDQVKLSQEEKRELFKKCLLEDPNLKQTAFKIVESGQFQNIVKKESGELTKAVKKEGGKLKRAVTEFKIAVKQQTEADREELDQQEIFQKKDLDLSEVQTNEHPEENLEDNQDDSAYETDEGKHTDMLDMDVEEYGEEYEKAESNVDVPEEQENNLEASLLSADTDRFLKAEDQNMLVMNIEECEEDESDIVEESDIEPSRLVIDTEEDQFVKADEQNMLLMDTDEAEESYDKIEEQSGTDEQEGQASDKETLATNKLQKIEDPNLLDMDVEQENKLVIDNLDDIMLDMEVEEEEEEESNLKEAEGQPNNIEVQESDLETNRLAMDTDKSIVENDSNTVNLTQEEKRKLFMKRLEEDENLRKAALLIMDTKEFKRAKEKTESTEIRSVMEADTSQNNEHNDTWTLENPSVKETNSNKVEISQDDKRKLFMKRLQEDSSLRKAAMLVMNGDEFQKAKEMENNSETSKREDFQNSIKQESNPETPVSVTDTGEFKKYCDPKSNPEPPLVINDEIPKVKDNRGNPGIQQERPSLIKDTNEFKKSLAKMEHLSQDQKRELFKKRLQEDSSLRKAAMQVLGTNKFKKDLVSIKRTVFQKNLEKDSNLRYLVSNVLGSEKLSNIHLISESEEYYKEFNNATLLDPSISDDQSLQPLSNVALTYSKFASLQKLVLKEASVRVSVEKQVGKGSVKRFQNLIERFQEKEFIDENIHDSVILYHKVRNIAIKCVEEKLSAVYSNPIMVPILNLQTDNTDYKNAIKNLGILVNGDWAQKVCKAEELHFDLEFLNILLTYWQSNQAPEKPTVKPDSQLNESTIKVENNTNSSKIEVKYDIKNDKVYENKNKIGKQNDKESIKVEAKSENPDSKSLKIKVDPDDKDSQSCNKVLVKTENTESVDAAEAQNNITVKNKTKVEQQPKIMTSINDIKKLKAAYTEQYEDENPDDPDDIGEDINNLYDQMEPEPKQNLANSPTVPNDSTQIKEPGNMTSKTRHIEISKSTKTDSNGKTLIMVDPLVKIRCNVCSDDSSTNFEALVRHYSLDHFKEPIERKYVTNWSGSCDLCRNEFASKNELIIHIGLEHEAVQLQVDVSRGGYQCSVCKKEFVNETYYKQHLINSHFSKQIEKHFLSPKNLLQCTFCKVRFPSKREVLCHIGITHVNVESFLDSSKKDENKAISNSNQQIKCKYCSFISEFPDMKIHYMDEHFFIKLQNRCKEENLLSEENKCCFCDQTMGTSKELVQHLGVKHNKVLKFMVSVSAKKRGPFSQQPNITALCTASPLTESINLKNDSNVNLHQNIDTSVKKLSQVKVELHLADEHEKPKTTTSIGSDNNIIHQNSKSYNNSCVETVHQDPEIKTTTIIPFPVAKIPCNLCNDKSSANFGDLVKHYSLIHYQDSIEKKYLQSGTGSCDLCKKSFTSKPDLIIHIGLEHNVVELEISSLKKTYPCPICAKEFISEPFKKQHIISSHFSLQIEEFLSIEFPLTCSFCHQDFANKQNVLFHIGITHGKVEPFLIPYTKEENLAKNAVEIKCKYCSHTSNFIQMKSHYLEEHFFSKVEEICAKENHLNSKNRCNICGVSTVSKRELINHLGIIHNKILKFIVGVVASKRSHCNQPPSIAASCNVGEKVVDDTFVFLEGGANQEEAILIKKEIVDPLDDPLAEPSTIKVNKSKVSNSGTKSTKQNKIEVTNNTTKAKLDIPEEFFIQKPPPVTKSPLVINTEKFSKNIIHKTHNSLNEKVVKTETKVAMPFPCTLCDEEFSSHERLNKHIIIFHYKNLLQSKLKEEQLKVDPPFPVKTAAVTCPNMSCKKIFRDEDFLIIHFSLEHTDFLKKLNSNPEKRLDTTNQIETTNNTYKPKFSFSFQTKYNPTPAPQTAIPSLKTAIPSPNTAITSLNLAIPSIQAAIPSPQMAIPSPKTAIPSLQTSVPSLQTASLSSQTVIPSLHTAIPSPQTAIQSPQTAIPSPQTAIPSPQTAIPSPQTALPSPQTAIPSPQTAIPSLQTAISSPQTSIPSPQSAIPSLQTAIPYSGNETTSSQTTIPSTCEEDSFVCGPCEFRTTQEQLFFTHRRALGHKLKVIRKHSTQCPVSSPAERFCLLCNKKFPEQFIFDHLETEHILEYLSKLTKGGPSVKKEIEFEEEIDFNEDIDFNEEIASKTLIPYWFGEFKNFCLERKELAMMKECLENDFSICNASVLTNFLKEILINTENISKLDEILKDIRDGVAKFKEDEIESFIDGKNIHMLHTVKQHLLIKEYERHCSNFGSNLKNCDPMYIIIFLSQLMGRPDVPRADMIWVLLAISDLHSGFNGKPLKTEQRIVDFFKAINLPLSENKNEKPSNTTNVTLSEDKTSKFSETSLKTSKMKKKPFPPTELSDDSDKTAKTDDIVEDQITEESEIEIIDIIKPSENSLKDGKIKEEPCSNIKLCDDSDQMAINHKKKPVTIVEENDDLVQIGEEKEYVSSYGSEPENVDEIENSDNDLDITLPDSDLEEEENTEEKKKEPIINQSNLRIKNLETLGEDCGVEKSNLDIKQATPKVMIEKIILLEEYKTLVNPENCKTISQKNQISDPPKRSRECEEKSNTFEKKSKQNHSENHTPDIKTCISEVENNLTEMLNNTEGEETDDIVEIVTEKEIKTKSKIATRSKKRQKCDQINSSQNKSKRIKKMKNIPDISPKVQVKSETIEPEEKADKVFFIGDRYIDVIW